MSRSIGDMVATSVGVTADPEIMVFRNLQPQDKAIVIATDGLWDRFSNEEVAHVVMDQDFYGYKDPEGCA